MDVHINLEQSAQSEPRIRLQLAENLLRETQSLIHRLEVCSSFDICFVLFFYKYSVFSLFYIINVVFVFLLG